MDEPNIWNDPGLQLPVAFAPSAMEQVRRSALEGMLSLRRVGVGVGGWLLGEYAGGKVTVLDTREIACAHNFGPSFRLTPEEVTAALAPVDGTGEPQVVGVYCSKPRGPAEVNDDDRRLFESLCPEPWQVLLVISPKSNNGSTGAVYSRAAGRALRGGAQLLVGENRDVPAAVKPAALAKPERVPLPELIPEALPLRPAATPAPKAPPAPKASPAPKAPPPERVVPVRPDVPLFSQTVPLFAQNVPARRAGPPSWRNPKLLWAAAAVILVLLGLAAFLTQDRWMPGPPLELRSYDSGGVLTVEWNRGAVRGIENGTLLFTDGTDTKSIVLNGLQLHSGWLRYSRKTGHVEVIMRAGSRQETTTYKDKPLAEAPVSPARP